MLGCVNIFSEHLQQRMSLRGAGRALDDLAAATPDVNAPSTDASTTLYIYG
jgi:hypothetical protein